MLSKPYLIINETEVISSALSKENRDFIFAIEIPSGSTRTIEQIYSSIFEDCNTQFCILINYSSDVTVWSEFFEYVISISFHEYYRRPVLNMLFLVCTKTDDQLEQLIISGAKENGYDDAILWNLAIPPALGGLNVISSNENIGDQYYNFLKGYNNGNFNLIIKPGDKGDRMLSVEQVKNELQKAEARLQENDRSIYQLLRSNFEYRSEMEILNNRLLACEEFLAAKNSYANSELSADFKEKKINEIVTFYNYEYEILPLWFKRLGHVVKVLTGKRSFKSLFNNNVKKYKGDE